MRSRRLFAAAAAAAWLAFGAAVADPGAHPGASLYNLEETWTNQDGASVKLGALAGKPVVLAMGYTTCKDMCPAIVADMMWVEKHLPPDAASRVRFAFFSFDSEADTPERLRLYADGHGMDLARWTLLSGEDEAVRELSAALNVPFRPNDRNGFDHASVISLLDAKGQIVFQQRGARASSDELLARLGALLRASD